MLKEKRMLQAQILKDQGFKQKEIAECLEVSERTVRNYLSNEAKPMKKRAYPSKLDSFKDFINVIVHEKPFYNVVLLFERLQNLGYKGRISILRDYVAEVRNKILSEAVIRFETEPGYQAQVDWADFGKYVIAGREQKLYGFAMTLGFSRKSFFYFTTSMVQGVLHACHIKAFEYFGGIVKEILYDNMKTAFISDMEGNFYPNKRLLAFARHYGFAPKRCMVRRPQTKGKVERFIGYVKNNFWQSYESENINLDELNEKVVEWLKKIDENKIKELQQSRAERFEQEYNILTKLPEVHFETRETYELFVNRESLITFETNRYSVPPCFIGSKLTLKVDVLNSEAEIFEENNSIRKFNLGQKGAHKKIYFPEDKREIFALWQKSKNRRLTKEKAAIAKRKRIAEQETETGNPALYDQLMEVPV